MLTAFFRILLAVARQKRIEYLEKAEYLNHIFDIQVVLINLIYKTGQSGHHQMNLYLNTIYSHYYH